MDSVLKHYTGRVLEERGVTNTAALPQSLRPAINLPDENDPPDATEDHGAYGHLRGVRERAVMLELRKKDGGITAVAYSWIERIDYDPSTGITIHTAGRTITIKGRNLNTEADGAPGLFQALTRHRVPWVREANSGDTMRAGDRTPVVESIHF